MGLIKVGNLGENSYKFNLKNGGHVVIQGKHKRAIITNEPMITAIDQSDWDEILGTYGKYMPEVMPSHKKRLIFALKNDKETLAMAADKDLNELETGTKKLTTKDLQKGIKAVVSEATPQTQEV